MKRLFMAIMTSVLVTASLAQNINKAEYFIDHDPGQGNGTAIPIATPGGTVNFPASIALNGLANGFHLLAIRVANTDGTWSMYDHRTFYILSATGGTNVSSVVAAEYFFDSDPGPGNGTATPVGTTGDVVTFTVLAPTNLSPGFHWLGIRTKDSDGKWGFYDRRNFYITSAPVDMTGVASAEYFFDSDPGVGNGSPLAFNTPAYVVTQTFPIPIPAGMTGTHLLVMRVKDQQGNWGLFAKDSFNVGGITINCPANVTVTAPSGQCTAVVNGLEPTVSPSGTTYNYTLTGATTGNGIGSASGHTFNAGVTTVTYGIATAPAISCSFTVTVNANAPSVTIGASQTTICAGTSVTFTPTPTNGGNTPSYVWKVNGNNVGTGATYQSSTLANNDVVTAVMTSSLACVNPTTATSNPIAMTVTSAAAPSVTISASQTTICSGTLVTFTPTPTNGGSSPTYVWKVNGNSVGTGSTYQSSTLTNNDLVTAVMTSSSSCASPTTTTSNTITMIVNSAVAPSVTISASQTTICSGIQVTFTPTPTNGGSSPTYVWKVNGVNVGTGAGYQSSTLANNDVITAVMTSSLTCANPTTDTSNAITMIVTSAAIPSVTIATPQTTICSGTQATFTATPTNGGTPTYQWKLNGNNVGDGSNMYQNSNLASGDEVKVVMTSSLGCASPQSTTSNGITMTVLQSSPASVSIAASATTICSGASVTFTAAPVGGGTPTYQWQLNGNNIAGATSSTYQSSSLANGDKIRVVVTPSSPCAFPSPVISNQITMTVNSGGAASVVITASQTTICTGQLVTFTATITNGGTAPAYEWTRNGNVVGSNTDVYQTTSLANGDVVRLTMQPYGSCSGNAAVYSNTITVTVGAGVTPSVIIAASAIDICAGTPVTFTATPTNGGNNPHYQWKLNGTNVGGDSAVLHISSLANADTIRTVMTSSLSCAVAPTAVSNYISMDVSVSVAPSVTITADNNQVCAGAIAKFTAHPVNGGGNPSYQWKLNGNNVGLNSDTYQSSSLANNDVVSVVMTSSIPCASPLADTSNTVTVQVFPTSTYYRDLDGDGFGSAASGTIGACNAPSGYVSNNTDCNDNNATVHPGATEVCGNNIDDDCDGQIDESCETSLDNDGDGYTVAQGDCNDNNAAIHPGATEKCGNGIDDDCDGQIDEDCGKISLPALTLRTYPVKEGNAGLTTLKAVVSLDTIAMSPATVHYSTSNGDAIAGLDYVGTSGVLTIPAGSSTGMIEVKIIGDLLRESNERFLLNFTDPVNLTLPANPRSQIMIIDDDKGKINTTNSTDNTIAKGELLKIPSDGLLKIPSIARRNQVWVIPQIERYENEVLIMDTQGQLVSRLVNYRNHTTIGSAAAGIYFYQIRILDGGGQVKYYSGRLLITE